MGEKYEKSDEVEIVLGEKWKEVGQKSVRLVTERTLNDDRKVAKNVDKCN